MRRRVRAGVARQGSPGARPPVSGVAGDRRAAAACGQADRVLPGCTHLIPAHSPSCPPRPPRSYLYVRMLCNPQLYGVPIDALDTDPLMQVGVVVGLEGWCGGVCVCVCVCVCVVVMVGVWVGLCAGVWGALRAGCRLVLVLAPPRALPPAGAAHGPGPLRRRHAGPPQPGQVRPPLGQPAGHRPGQVGVGGGQGVGTALVGRGLGQGVGLRGARYGLVGPGTDARCCGCRRCAASFPLPAPAPC